MNALKEWKIRDFIVLLFHMFPVESLLLGPVAIMVIIKFKSAIWMRILDSFL